MPRPIRFALTLSALASLFATAPAATASTLAIGFTGLDLVYANNTLSDSNPAGADFLSSISVEQDGVPIPSLMSGGGTPMIDLSIDNVPAIPSAGTTAPVDGGALTFTLPGGEVIAMSLNEVTLTQLSKSNSIEFVFGGAVATIDSQTPTEVLPSGTPVSVSFTGPMSGMQMDNDAVIAFVGAAAGTLESVIAVPEPAAAAVVGLLASMGIGIAWMRARLG